MAHPKYRYPPGLKQAIFQRDNHQCRIRLPGCTHHPTDLDHINPTGAWHDPHNLRAACSNCNQARKHNTPRTPTHHTTGRW